MIHAWWRGDLAYVSGFLIYGVVATSFVLILRRFPSTWALQLSDGDLHERPRTMTLRQAAISFLQIGSLQLLLAGVVVAAATRVAIGDWSWLDLAIVGSTMGIWPFQEWLFHAYLLHMKPVRLFGFTFEPIFVKTHRTHHLHPSVPRSGVVPFLFVSLYLAFLPFVWHLILPLPQALSGVVASLVLLCTYEWIHFLIHTPYKPVRSWFLSLWRHHRLHHFRNENYWFGVTTSLADRALQTHPPKEAIAKSASCLSLGSPTRSDESMVVCESVPPDPEPPALPATRPAVLPSQAR